MSKEILIVTETFGVDGPERVLSELTNQWVKDGYNIIAVITRSEKNEATYSYSEKIKLFYIDAHKKGGKFARVKEIFELRKILKRYPTAVCISLMISTSFSLAFASVGLRNQVILSERNDPHKVPFTRFQRKMRDISFEFADNIVFQTVEAMAYFPLRIRKKGKIIFNPVNPDLPQKHEGMREKKIVAAGRLAEQKNFPLLINAFTKLWKEYPDYHLIICGEGADRGKLQKQINDNNMNEYITLKGFVKNVYKEMVNSTIYVSSSNYEGMSNSMLEALAMGIPSVCTDCPIGGARTVIDNGINGLLVPVKDENALYVAMKTLIEDKRLAKKLSDEAYKIRNKLEIKKIASEWTALFK